VSFPAWIRRLSLDTEPKPKSAVPIAIREHEYAIAGVAYCILHSSPKGAFSDPFRPRGPYATALRFRGCVHDLIADSIGMYTPIFRDHNKSHRDDRAQIGTGEREVVRSIGDRIHFEHVGLQRIGYGLSEACQRPGKSAF
jgi:hypothetical protein